MATPVDEDAGRVGELSATDLLDLHSQLLAAEVEKLLHLKVPAAEDQNVFAIVDEGERIPACGIEFDLSPADKKNITRSLLSSVRRLHINCGHPPNED